MAKGVKSDAEEWPRRKTPPGEPLPDDLADAIEWSSPLPVLANWRDAAAYPAELSLRAWGWEFLRRNPEYQLQWSQGALRPALYGIAQGVDPSLSPCEPPLAVMPEQPERIRARTSLYPTYLRILDARRAGATIGEIDRVLFERTADKGKADDVQKKMKAAAKLVWHDYRRLLMR